MLLVLAIPVLGLRLGFSDESNFAEDTTTQQAYDLLVDGFGPGFNGPLILVAEVDGGRPTSRRSARSPTRWRPTRASPFVLAAAARTTRTNPTAVPLARDPDRRRPQDEATTELVEPAARRRAARRPRRRPASTSLVTGQRRRPTSTSPTTWPSGMPYFFGAVLALSFLLLMVVFRSLLVPLKAVIMNLLSIGAAYGVVVAVFQWGWLSDITGIAAGARSSRGCR